jgi:lysophospholipase L1-like esterase
VTSQRLHPAEASDPYCLTEGEAERLLAGHPWRRFAVVGDSIAEGIGDPWPGYPDQPWCERIALELSQHVPDFAYLNLGVQSTPSEVVRDTQLAPALEFKPDLVMVAAGGYDILNPFYNAPAVDAAIREMVAAFTEAGADVITVGLLDGSKSPVMPHVFKVVLRTRIRNLAARAAAIAADYNALHLSMTNHPAAVEESAYSADPRHGSMRGHAIVVAETVRMLGRHLEAVGRPAAVRQRVAKPDPAALPESQAAPA